MEEKRAGMDLMVILLLLLLAGNVTLLFWVGLEYFW